MGVAKIHTKISQFIHIRCFCLGMTTQKTCPVIHIINGNKQNIRFFIFSSN